MAVGLSTILHRTRTSDAFLADTICLWPSCTIHLRFCGVLCIASLDGHAQLTRCFSVVAELPVY